MAPVILRNILIPGAFFKAWRHVRIHLPPLNFITLHYAYFIGVCMLSSVIFWGSSTPARSVSYTDSLFLVVSAMTLAGLNTINLSVLNTFQQFILFLLIILGSAILVSIVVVHTRRKAFETHLKTIIEAAKQKRRDRSGSRKRLSFNRSADRSGLEVDGVVVRGRAIKSEKSPQENSNGTVIDNLQSFASTDGPISPTPRNPSKQESLPDLETGHTVSDPSLAIDSAVTRRITFASPSSPTRQREHGRFLSMQGVGARPNLMNHPKQTELPIYTSDLPKIDEKGPANALLHSGFLHNGTVARNSQFSNLSLAERQRLGGAEYRAVTILAIIVPMYFVLWQLLGCIGLGAYVATKRSDVTTGNGLNPWFDEIRQYSIIY